MDAGTTRTDVNKGLSRRTVLKGTAWTVPALVAVTAAPLAAASGDTPSELLYFYITAFNVSGNSTAVGRVEANGVRISPQDSSNPKIFAAGTVYEITITYTGSNPDFDFTDVPNYDAQLATNVGPGRWNSGTVERTTIRLSWTTTIATTELSAPSFGWNLGPAGGPVIRPEDDSIVITGVATIAPGADFPNGGTIPTLIVDPNQGTGSLTGPTPETWPTV